MYVPADNTDSEQGKAPLLCMFYSFMLHKSHMRRSWEDPILQEWQLRHRGEITCLMNHIEQNPQFMSLSGEPQQGS